MTAQCWCAIYYFSAHSLAGLSLCHAGSMLQKPSQSNAQGYSKYMLQNHALS